MILLNHVRYLDLDFVVAVFLNLRVAVKKKYYFEIHIKWNRISKWTVITARWRVVEPL